MLCIEVLVSLVVLIKNRVSWNYGVMGAGVLDRYALVTGIGYGEWRLHMVALSGSFLLACRYEERRIYSFYFLTTVS